MLASELMHVKDVRNLGIPYFLHDFHQRELFFTKEDRFGFTMRGVKPGDLVCVFDGALAPHVLSKVDSSKDGKDSWRFVGDAFVHGLMHGEADEMHVDDTEFCMV